MIVERNPPERKFLYMLKIFSQEDFALKSNCDRWAFRNTYLFLLATRISPASPNSWQAKQGHKKYEKTDWKCRACDQQVREDQEHVTHCEGYEDLKAKADLMNEEELVQFFTRVMERRQEMNWD